MKFRKIYTLSPPLDVVDSPQSQSPILTQDTNLEGNLDNISSTVAIYISIKECIVENVHLGADCSLEEVEAYTTLFKELCDVFTWSY
jgi:hypothetical protein